MASSVNHSWSAHWFKPSCYPSCPKLERPLVSRGNNGPFTVVQLGVWPTDQSFLYVPILIWIESTNTHANGHPRLTLSSQETDETLFFFFFGLAPYFPVRNPRPGRCWVATWDTTRSLDVNGKSSDLVGNPTGKGLSISQCWIVETRIPKVTSSLYALTPRRIIFIKLSPVMW